ncbi:MAG: MFS transporter [Planctomycetota bacterium]
MAEAEPDRSNRKADRRNYIFHSIEGGLYGGGMAFMAAGSVLPRLVELLDGPTWVIGLSPVLVMLGFTLPPIFTTHRIERLLHVHRFLVVRSFLQRLPYLIAGLALVFLDANLRWLILTVVVGAQFISGFFGGMYSPAWQELVAKTISPKRRASVFAIRNLITACIGVAAGILIALILDRYPGLTGYGVLHLIAFGLLFLSLLAFAQIREVDHSEQSQTEVPLALLESWRRLIGFVREDRRFQRFLVIRMLVNGILVMSPFLTIHVLKVTGRPDSFMGSLVTAQMIGGLVGNAMAGLVGDRLGGKVVLLVGRLGLMVICLIVPFAAHPWVFIPTFFFMGIFTAASTVGAMTLGLEVAPRSRQSGYGAVISFAIFVSMLGASLLSALLMEVTENFTVPALTAAGLLAVCVLCLLKLEEPRRQ